MKPKPSPPDFQGLVDQFYQPLYRFAFGLSRSEATAADLTQQTFFIWAKKGHQLQDPSKAKSWLFTTLRREFLSGRRTATRYPHVDMEYAQSEMPSISPEAIQKADVHLVLEAIDKLGDVYRDVVLLFHVEDHSYKEIAAQLEIPIGTVMSRLARGRKQLYVLLSDPADARPTGSNVVPFPRPSNTETGS